MFMAFLQSFDGAFLKYKLVTLYEARREKKNHNKSRLVISRIFYRFIMKIVFDDAKSILGQLVNLYMSLPEELRTKNDIIPASELIFEAIE